jgi:hypothetical protein
MKTYEYTIIDASVARAWFSPRHPDAYVASDSQLELLQRALADGCRWVRTEGECAIFEKEVAVDNSVPSVEYIGGMHQMAHYVAAGWFNYRKIKTPQAFQAKCSEIIDEFVDQTRNNHEA